MTAVVIDNGTGIIKAGMAGEDAPKSCFPTVIGYPKYQQIQGIQDQSYFIGEEAISRKGVLKLRYPLQNGIVDNWDDM